MARTLMTEAQERAHWAGHIQLCSHSGQSVAGYCRNSGLCVIQFRAWRRRLRYEARKQATSGAAPALIPLSVTTARADPCSKPQAASGVTIRLASGVAIEVAPEFETATLRAVVQALGDCDVLA